ncbi:hypothetical protein PF001_g16258 [Phytophthora fragariae]|nr:hypothetical protein PF001_g16258 [Phytophthora fragariae]
MFLLEYKFAVDPVTIGSYDVEDEELFVALRRDGRSHRVDKFNWTCTCELYTTMQLPCRHAMMYRKHVAGMLTIPYALVPERWLRAGTLDLYLLEVNIPIRISTGTDDLKSKKRVTERDKYKSVQNVFNRITSEMTELPEAKFQAALDGLEIWWGNLRQGDIELPGPDKDSKQITASDEGLTPTQVTAHVQTDGLEEKDDKVHMQIEKKKRGGGQKKMRASDQSAMNAANMETTFDMGPFNPRAKRVGRPTKNRAAEQVNVSKERKDYNTGAKLRNALRGEDVVKVEGYLKTCKPPLKELLSFFENFRRALPWSQSK